MGCPELKTTTARCVIVQKTAGLLLLRVQSLWPGGSESTLQGNASIKPYGMTSHKIEIFRVTGVGNYSVTEMD